MKYCICKIKNNGNNGTGFFCNICNKINEKMPVLITNNHILGDKDLILNNIIKITLNDNKISKKILLDKNRRVFTNQKYDITI